MKDKICALTGANSGIGKEIAISMAELDYEMILLMRNSEKSKFAFEEIKEKSGSLKIHMIFVDLSSLQSICNAVLKIKEEFSRIDILINNAGVFKWHFEKSIDDIEMTLAVNYFAPFHLTNSLMPLLLKSNSARIINVGSEAYKQSKFDMNNPFFAPKGVGFQRYAHSKLLLLHLTHMLAARHRKDSISVHCVHPGFIATNVFRDIPNWIGWIIKQFIQPPAKGAKPIVYLARSEEVKGVSGKYYKVMQAVDTSKIELSEEHLRKLWNATEERLKALS